jgi:SAM-dependent methyltransferase
MVFSKNTQSIFEGSWEYQWAPYDPPTYQAVLEQLRRDDIALDIGAGDLRLARQMAKTVHKVYSVEINPGVLEQGLKKDEPLPGNLIPICADTRTMDFPSEVTVGILLMRHCTHFRVYANKLRDINCQRLVTNARWRMSVETIDLLAPRIKFEQIKIGWYACWCGTVGFKSGPVELLTPEANAIIHEVIDCPDCLSTNLALSRAKPLDRAGK